MERFGKHEKDPGRRLVTLRHWSTMSGVLVTGLVVGAGTKPLHD